MTLLWVLVTIAAVSVLAFNYASLKVWSIAIALGLVFLTQFSGMHGVLLSVLWIVFIALFGILNCLPLRQKLLSKYLLAFYKKVMPQMSSTEREALEAGTVGFEGEVFSGHPNWDKLHAVPAYHLSVEEQEFLDGPVNQLCEMIDDWDITHNKADMPEEIWQFLKDQGFFSFIIEKKYGGRQFSAQAQAAILTRVYGRSVSVASTIAVPNSLGPAELLKDYGTEQQKDYYLPRLAKGLDVPCFALTSPRAGSDAASIPDFGIVCKGEFEGREVIGITLNWNKRYITLAPAATLIGLAFQLHDPDGLLGEQKELGITCALIPSETKGVVSGRRHAPLNAAFLNGPTQGHDVFIPLDWIIGGVEMAGQGWRMLMECLGAGRAISLPSSAVGGAQVGLMSTSAYSRIRRQFNLPIGRFEGIEVPLARIAANTYIIDAGLKFTTAVIDSGESPSIASAILKYHTTEIARSVINDAMDIQGGKGICMGPKNVLGRYYQTTPISITVEGANILTRSLIIFGQGVMRCHPYVFNEFEAALKDDLPAFDKAIFGHVGYLISSMFRSFWLAMSLGRFAKAPKGCDKRMYQIISRFSAALAIISELSLLGLGSALKRKEKISARLGDMISVLYLCSSVLKKFKDDGKPASDWPIVQYACESLLFQAQLQLRAVIDNFPNRILAVLMRVIAFPFGMRRKMPSDKLGHKLATLMIGPNPARSRLIDNVFKKAIENNPAGMIETLLPQVIAIEAIEQRVKHALRKGELEGYDYHEQIDHAATKGIITSGEARQLKEVDDLRMDVINVDDFSSEELMRVLNAVNGDKQQNVA